MWGGRAPPRGEPRARPRKAWSVLSQRWRAACPVEVGVAGWKAVLRHPGPGPPDPRDALGGLTDKHKHAGRRGASGRLASGRRVLVFFTTFLGWFEVEIIKWWCSLRNSYDQIDLISFFHFVIQ